MNSTAGTKQAPVQTVDSIEVIPGRLFWVSVDGSPRPSEPNMVFFNIDKELAYEPFASDFGPVNLGMTYRYCKALQAKLSDPALQGFKIIHHCSAHPHKRANAAYLVLAYLVIVERKSADAAWARLQAAPTFMPFRDASAGPCTYDMTILDALRGLEKAMSLGWFSYDKFNLEDYQFMERVENGDMSWVIPQKFLAFAGPNATSVDADGFPACTPEHYAPHFRRMNVTTVVRLNKKQYDRRQFTDQGFRHEDLYFMDGSCPSKPIIEKFLKISEEQAGGIAVHCKAGLGRTGTLIGLYAQKHHGFSGRAFIGWNRICRPGAILGPQQQFLVDMEQFMWQQGQLMKTPRAALSLPQPTQEAAEAFEDVGQGERLVRAKKDHTPKAGANTPSAMSTASTNASPVAGASEAARLSFGLTATRSSR